MGWLSDLFGGASKPEVPAGEDYNGFHITPQAMKAGTVWHIAARITFDVDGETKVHDLIRADTLQTQEEAAAASVAKAKQLIDQQGTTIFER